MAGKTRETMHVKHQEETVHGGPDPSILLKHLMPEYGRGHHKVKNVVQPFLDKLGASVVAPSSRDAWTLFGGAMGGPIHNGSTIMPQPGQLLGPWAPVFKASP